MSSTLYPTPTNTLRNLGSLKTSSLLNTTVLGNTPVLDNTETHINKIILYGLLDNMQIRKSSFSGISIQVNMPDIMFRRMSKAIALAQSNPAIPHIELQNQLQNILESFYRSFVLLRDITSSHSDNHVEFICIGLNAEIIHLIQAVYPHSNRISYNVSHTVEDAMMTKYAEYLEILSPPSSTASSPHSTTSSPHSILSVPSVPSIFDNQISTIPFPNGCKQVIYLGDDYGANNFTKLSELGITHILNVSDCIPNYYESTTNITYMRVPIADCGSVILKDYFPNAFEFITSALETGGRILVHCFAGKSRSASFVIAYLMQNQKMNYMDAFMHVQTHRAIVEPNFGFELQLNAFEKSITPNS